MPDQTKLQHTKKYINQNLINLNLKKEHLGKINAGKQAIMNSERITYNKNLSAEH